MDIFQMIDEHIVTVDYVRKTNCYFSQAMFQHLFNFVAFLLNRLIL